MKIDDIVKKLTQATHGYELPLNDQIVAEYGKDPYRMLIACLLSLRAKDTTTIHVCRALFSRVRTPKQLLKLTVHDLEKIIYKSGFYKTKARVLRGVSQTLLDHYDGKVPASVDAMMSIKGIGPKTANLIAAQAFGIPAICVDTHVHRISNRLGLIATKTVEQTERALQRVLPKKYWIVWNGLLVTWGQHVCTPVSPKCSQCVIYTLCKWVGVTKHR